MFAGRSERTTASRASEDVYLPTWLADRVLRDCGDAAARRVLLVVDVGTGRLVATRALSPPDVDHSAMIAEFAAVQGTDGQGSFALRDLGELDVHGRPSLYLELSDAAAPGTPTRLSPAMKRPKAPANSRASPAPPPATTAAAAATGSPVRRGKLAASIPPAAGGGLVVGGAQPPAGRSCCSPLLSSLLHRLEWSAPPAPPPRGSTATAAAAAYASGAAAVAAARPLRGGIALMTRKPHRFDWWLRYHRSLGICRAFVHVEDTPELVKLLATPEFADFVSVTTASDLSEDALRPDSQDNYYTLMARQERQVRRAVSECRALGIDWLFHVDDDELLHFEEPFSSIVKDLAPSPVGCVVLTNIEAVPTALECECVFENITSFTSQKMLAYRNGKSAGRCATSNWHGPHRFTGSYVVVPTSRACLLHFESCLYEGWRNKFLKHRDIDEKKKEAIPFPFYRDSISLFQKDGDGGRDEARWKAFYQRRKIDHFKEVPGSQRMRLRLTDHPEPMI